MPWSAPSWDIWLKLTDLKIVFPGTTEACKHEVTHFVLLSGTFALLRDDEKTGLHLRSVPLSLYVCKERGGKLNKHDVSLASTWYTRSIFNCCYYTRSINYSISLKYWRSYRDHSDIAWPHWFPIHLCWLGKRQWNGRVHQHVPARCSV